MKKISLKTISETLSEKEMKRVVGGDGCGGPCPAGMTCSGGVCIIGDGECNWYRCWCTQPLSPVVTGSQYPIVQASDIIGAVNMVSANCLVYGNVGCTFDKPC